MTEDTESTDETAVQHDDQTVDATDASTLSRRAALAGLGLAGLFGLGTGTASADAQGQVGTASDPLQALYTDTLYAGDAGTITLGDALDLKGNDISFSDSFDFHINAGSWPYVAFTDTNSQSEVRIDWDQNLFSLHRTDFQIRDGGVLKDDTGATAVFR